MQEECVNAFLFTFLVDIRDVRGLFFFLRDNIVWGGVVCFLMESANMDSKLKYVLSLRPTTQRALSHRQEQVCVNPGVAVRQPQVPLWGRLI